MQLNLYFFRQYAFASLMVLLGLMSVVWINHVLRILEFVVIKGADSADFIVLSVFPVPLWLMVATPIAGFIAVIWVITKLLSDRELIVLHSVGFSPLQLSAVPIMFGGLITLLMLFNSIYILPTTFSQFKHIQNNVRSSIPKLLVQDNVFTDISDGLTLFVGKRLNNNEVSQVFIQDSRNSDIIVTLTAERGQFTTQNNNPVLLLKNGQRSEVNKTNRAYAQLTFETHTLDIGQQTNESQSEYIQDMNEESITDLLNPATSISPQYTAKRISMGHYRLASPFLGLALSIIAVAVMVQGRNIRENIKLRIGCASLIAILIQTFMILSRSLTATSASAWPLMYVCVLIPSICGLIIIWRPITRLYVPLAAPSLVAE